MAALDHEIDAAMDILARIQGVVGGAEGTEGSTRSGSASAYGGDEFMILKVDMMRKFEIATQAVAEASQLSARAGNPTEKIRKQQEVRDLFKDLSKDLKDLEAKYTVEKNKRKSKFSPAELESRGEIVSGLKEHLEELKGEFTAAYSGTAASGGKKLPTFEEFKSEIDKQSQTGGGMGQASVKVEQERITSQQQQRLQMIQSRDKDMDRTVELIGNRVEALGDIAVRMGEEVKVQNAMIDQLGQAVDEVQQHLDNVNATLAKTLKQVRASDRMCMDVICILLMMGLIGVIIKIASSK